MKTSFCRLGLLFALVSLARADVKLPAIFSDRMVLQGICARGGGRSRASGTSLSPARARRHRRGWQMDGQALPAEVRRAADAQSQGQQHPHDSRRAHRRSVARFRAVEHGDDRQPREGLQGRAGGRDVPAHPAIQGGIRQRGHGPGRGQGPVGPLLARDRGRLLGDAVFLRPGNPPDA